MPAKPITRWGPPLLGCLLLAPAAHADILRVPYDYASITEACGEAVAGDTVAVYPGTYYDEGATVFEGVSVIGMGENPTQVKVWSSGWGVFSVHRGELPVLIENLTAYQGHSVVLDNHNPQLLIHRCHLVQTYGTFGGNIVHASEGFELRECWMHCACDDEWCHIHLHLLIFIIYLTSYLFE